MRPATAAQIFSAPPSRLFVLAPMQFSRARLSVILAFSTLNLDDLQEEKKELLAVQI